MVITLASGTTAFVASVTRPVSEALVDCANAARVESSATTVMMMARRMPSRSKLRMGHQRNFIEMNTRSRGHAPYEVPNGAIDIRQSQGECCPVASKYCMAHQYNSRNNRRGED